MLSLMRVPKSQMLKNVAIVSAYRDTSNGLFTTSIRRLIKAHTVENDVRHRSRCCWDGNQAPDH